MNTTANIMLQFPQPSAQLIRLENWLRRLVMTFLDWSVDASRWAMRRMRNRRGYPKGNHRQARGEQQESVWDILRDSRHGFIWKPRGQHRDRRGWRYKSAVYSLQQRMQAERAEKAYWEMTVEHLMEDIRLMLENPPQVETVHGCDNCRCAVNA